MKQKQNSGIHSFKPCRAYQEEHPLLVTLPGVFQQAAVPYERPARLYQIIEADYVPLQFAQRCQVFRTR